MDYTHLFTKDSKIIFSALYERAALSGTTYNNNLKSVGSIDTIQYTVNPTSNPLNAVRLKTDYTQKVGKGNIQIGYQFRYDTQKGNFLYLTKNLGTNSFTTDAEFSSTVNVLNRIHAGYFQYTQTSKKGDGSPFPENALVQRALNDEFERQWILQADYINPIGKEGKFETGLRTSFRDMTNDYIVTQQEPSGIFTIIPGLRNIFLYKENISAAYMILGNKMKKFSYQFGMRGEVTDIQTQLVQTKEKNPRNYANLFPSAHFTYTQNEENSFQLGFSRRVRRPTYNELSPFVTLSDNRNFFSGNPDLNPEFTNSFDLGYLKYFDLYSLSQSKLIK
jgi:outer membrane receptor protein involved in Fe transport